MEMPAVGNPSDLEEDIIIEEDNKPQTDTNNTESCVKNCMLPEKNTHYAFHLLFLIFCYFGLLCSYNDMTFSSIIMYLVPIWIDLFAVSSKSKFFTATKWIFMFYNFVCVAICGLGLFGKILDKTTFFMFPETGVLFAGLRIDKHLASLVLAAEMAVPLVLWIGSPTKKKCLASMKAQKA